MLNKTEFKNGVKNLWGKITDEDFDSTQGDITKLISLVSEKYLMNKDEIQNRIQRLLSSFDNESDQGASPDRSSFEREPNNMRTEFFGAHSGYRRGVPDYNDGSGLTHYGGNDDYKGQRIRNEVQESQFGKVAEGNRGRH